MICCKQVAFLGRLAVSTMATFREVLSVPLEISMQIEFILVFVIKIVRL